VQNCYSLFFHLSKLIFLGVKMLKLYECGTVGRNVLESSFQSAEGGYQPEAHGCVCQAANTGD